MITLPIDHKENKQSGTQAPQILYGCNYQKTIWKLAVEQNKLPCKFTHKINPNCKRVGVL